MANYEIELRGGRLHITKTEGEGKDQKEVYKSVDLKNLHQQLPALTESRKILREMLKEIDDILSEVPPE